MPATAPTPNTTRPAPVWERHKLFQEPDWPDSPAPDEDDDEW